MILQFHRIKGFIENFGEWSSSFYIYIYNPTVHLFYEFLKHLHLVSLDLMANNKNSELKKEFMIIATKKQIVLGNG